MYLIVKCLKKLKPLQIVWVFLTRYDFCFSNLAFDKHQTL